MKKTSLVLAAMLIFSVAVWAQAGSAGGGAGSAAGSGAQGNRGADTQRAVPNTGTGSVAIPQSDQQTNNNNMKGQKTVEGCIVQSGSDIFLATKGNKKFFRLQGTDLSAHIGHKVKVHGTEQAAGGMAGNTGTAAGNSSIGASTGVSPDNTAAGASTTATAATPTASGQSQSAAATGDPGANDKASGLPQSSAAGASVGAGVGSESSANTSSSITVDPSKVSNKELLVSSIDMISESCSDMDHHDKNRDKNNQSNTSKPY